LADDGALTPERRGERLLNVHESDHP
jgi:hypothetical protein